jgi:hypothetical protein
MNEDLKIKVKDNFFILWIEKHIENSDLYKDSFFVPMTEELLLYYCKMMIGIDFDNDDYTDFKDEIGLNNYVHIQLSPSNKAVTVRDLLGDKYTARDLVFTTEHNCISMHASDLENGDLDMDETLRVLSILSILESKNGSRSRASHYRKVYFDK